MLRREEAGWKKRRRGSRCFEPRIYSHPERSTVVTLLWPCGFEVCHAATQMRIGGGSQQRRVNRRLRGRMGYPAPHDGDILYRQLLPPSEHTTQTAGDEVS